MTKSTNNRGKSSAVNISEQNCSEDEEFEISNGPLFSV
jgi:hypothetical protein